MVQGTLHHLCIHHPQDNNNLSLKKNKDMKIFLRMYFFMFNKCYDDFKLIILLSLSVGTFKPVGLVNASLRTLEYEA